VNIPAGPALVTKLTAGRVTVRGHTARVSLTCAAAAGVKCKGRAVLTSTEKLEGGEAIGVTAKVTRKRIVVGGANFSLAAGTTKVVSVPLNANGKKLLARFGKLPARLVVTLRGAKPTTVKRAKVTFRGK
jgi:hypothetical protein